MAAEEAAEAVDTAAEVAAVNTAAEVAVAIPEIPVIQATQDIQGILEIPVTPVNPDIQVIPANLIPDTRIRTLAIHIRTLIHAAGILAELRRIRPAESKISKSLHSNRNNEPGDIVSPGPLSFLGSHWYL